MAKYLGEKKVDVKKHPKYKKYTPTDWAMEYISSYGQIDGAHHKTWVLDQVARILKGSKVSVKTAQWSDGTEEDRITVEGPSKEYEKWVQEMQGMDEFGDPEYGYDEGTPP